MKFPDVQSLGVATIEGAGRYRMVMVSEEVMAELFAKSHAATPGPWLRRWASLDVHHMSGDDALTAQGDIDFAVAACAFVRDLLEHGRVDRIRDGAG